MSYYLAAYGKYALIGVIAILGFAAVVRLIYMGGVSPRDVTGNGYRPFKRKGWVYIVTVVFCAVSLYLTCMNVTRSCSATLTFNYDGASKGLNPNKTRFNQADLLGSDVLQRMADTNVLPGVTTEDLRDVLSITPEDSMEEIKEEDYRVSTQYNVEYTANRKTDALDSENVIRVYAAAYRDWFAEQYATNLTPLDIDFEQFADEDYLDICDHLDTEADRVENFMSVLRMNTRSFKSQETGEGFQSIETRAAYIANTLVSDLKAYILDNSLSKDVQTYLGRLSMKNILLDFDARKHMMQSRNWLAAIRKYEDDMASVVRVPTRATNGEFYMSQTKIGVDRFAEEAEDSSGKMIDFHSEIAGNNYLARMLDAGKSTAAAMAHADEMIRQIEAELEQTAGRAKALIKEYDAQQANGYLMVSIESKDDRMLSAVKWTLALGLAFFLILHLFCFLSEVNERRFKARRNQINRMPADCLRGE